MHKINVSGYGRGALTEKVTVLIVEDAESSRASIDVESRRPYTFDSFVDILWDRSRDTEGLRKGDRTKARLRASAVDVLENIGYREMTVADICKRADLTAASLYLYYDSKPSIVIEVLTEFLNEFFSTAKATKHGTLFQSVYAANIRWLKLARANAGLMRCLLQLREDEADFARLYSEANKKWYDRSVAAWEKRFTRSSFNRSTALLMSYVIGGLMDEIIRLMFINPDPHFRDALDSTAMTDENVAEMVTLIWYRSLTSKSPADTLSPQVTALFSPFRESKR